SPTPRIKWHVPNITFEESITSSLDVIENKLTVRSLRRESLGTNFTCEASNTDLVPSKRKSVKLDLILKPLTIKVSRPGSANKNESLQAKHRYDLECETTGSNPPAVITWYKGKRPLKHVSEERSQNLTISRVEFVPNVEDNRKAVTCRAENPNVKGLFLEESWILNVVYPPLVSLSLGSTLNAGDIKEGDDVYFECHINSNPSISKLIWIHNSDFTSRIETSFWESQRILVESRNPLIPIGLILWRWERYRPRARPHLLWLGLSILSPTTLID
ncbi:hypothetical protein KQX54_020070, partial [Cotesia glomerata]